MPPPTNPYQPYAKVHESPNGPGDARPTSLQVIEDEGLLGDGLKGRVFLITGCSSGLGIETARAVYAAGADVYMTVRESKQAEGEAVIKDILSTHPNSKGGKLELVFMDLSSFSSVRAGAADFLFRTHRIDVLIANAGVMLTPYGKTAEGWETQLGTNHFGHFLLFQLLKEQLLASATREKPSRVVMLTSAGHHLSGIRWDDMNFEGAGGYDGWLAYGQSKTANIYTAASIERHFSSRNLHAVSVHPGPVLDTNLPREIAKDPSLVGDIDFELLKPLSKSISQGAATQVWAAVTKYFNDRGGTYLAECGEVGPQPERVDMAIPGYGKHTYDEEGEERLWRLSCDAVGVGYE